VKRIVIAAFIVLLFVSGTQAENMTAKEWLVAGPVPLIASVEETAQASTYEALFEVSAIDARRRWPAKGDEIKLGPNTTATFQPGDLELGRKGDWMLAAAAYLDVDRWQRGSIKVKGAPAFRLYYEGEVLLERTSTADRKAEETAEVTLVAGKRRLFLIAAGNDELKISYESDSDAPAPNVALDPKHTFDIADYIVTESVSDLKLSPAGRYLAASLKHWSMEDYQRHGHVEIWDVASSEQLAVLPESWGVLAMEWSPDGTELLLKTEGSESGLVDLLVWKAQNGRAETVVRGLEDATDFKWAARGDGFFYLHTVSVEESDTPYKVMWGLEDRWTGWRDRQQLRWLSRDGRSNLLVWEGRYDADGYRVGNSGDAVYIMRSLPLGERPFERMELLRVELDGAGVTSLYTSRLQRDGSTRFAVSPDESRIAFLAGRYEVTGNDNTNPNINDLDMDLWILNITEGTVENLSREFEPAIGAFYYGSGRSTELSWGDDGVIRFAALMNKHVLHGSYDPATGEFETVDAITPGMNQLEFAERGTVVAYEGTSLDTRHGVHVADAPGVNAREMIPTNKLFHKVIDTSPKVIDYDYVNSEGITVPGYLYYPAGYDPDENYPMIIDYYGGVIGYGDGWDWNARSYQSHGYFVYTPIPRGAAGYGAEFANTHPNDWGTLTSRDINEGVRHIVANVPGVDGARVAPTSGSYGGYLTVYLLAMPKDHPDYYPYATGVAHAGIYDMATYWGKGDWGYLYNDMAAAGSWPWNATDKYILWSPVYRADNITVPLLLTHGDDDNNVPPENTDILYTALKVLDRDDIWFVRFPGQKHGLVQGGRKTYLDSRRMRIEWFDRVLKNDPAAFEWRMRDEMKK
jgi:dipeptidyl aminopeptidase/acylaminoacyl peptidase